MSTEPMTLTAMITSERQLGLADLRTDTSLLEVAAWNTRISFSTVPRLLRLHDMRQRGWGYPE
jgi:hypothetical protein